MFKKLLLKIFKDLSPEEKQKIRGSLEDNRNEVVVDEKESDILETEKEGEKEIMADDKKDDIKTNDTENVVDDGTKKPEENDKVENGEKVDEKVPTEPEEQGEENSAPEVQDTEPQGNGIRVEDLVTKSELMERLAAFEAKFDALIKENQDLKDKYENKNFGNTQRQGMMPKDKSANSSFDEYSKQFS